MAKAKAKLVPEVPEVLEVPEVPALRRIVLEGRAPNRVYFGINGMNSSLPCDEEVEVTEEVYHAVKAHIRKER